MRFNVVPSRLGLILFSTTATVAIGHCGFKVVDPRTASRASSWKEPVVLHNSFDWKPEPSSTEFVAKALENISIRLVPDEFRNRTFIANGFASPDFHMKFRDWRRETEEPNSQVPNYSFHWCRGECARTVGSLAVPPAFLAEYSSDLFLVVGRPGDGLVRHKHWPSWVMQLAGSKMWKVSAPDVLDPDDVITCEQREGDLVYIPDEWWHATSQKSSSIAIGGRPIPHRFGKVEDAGLWRQVVIGDVAGVTERLPSLSAAHTDQLTIQAALNGHVDVLEALSEHKEKEISDTLAEEVTGLTLSFGLEDILSWLLRRVSKEKVLELGAPHIGSAIMNNRQGVVKHLMEIRADISVDAVAEAFYAGHEGMLEMLLSKEMQRKELVKLITLVKKHPRGRLVKNQFPGLHHAMMETLKKRLKAASSIVAKAKV